MAAVPGSGTVKGRPTNMIRSAGASRSGTLSNWLPKRHDKARAALDREAVADRAEDLAANDPHVSGLIESMNINTVGVGFKAQSRMKGLFLPVTRSEQELLQRGLEWNWSLWSKEADIRRTKHFVDMLSVCDRSMLVRGEYLALPRYIKGGDKGEKFNFRLQVVDPLRLKTPADKIRQDNIVDGVECDDDGAPTHYWVVKDPSKSTLKSDNFTRIAAWRGWRKNVFHGFIERSPDQRRGEIFFTPALKFFRDLSDLLDSEVVSNIITSASSYYVQTSYPDQVALQAAQSSGLNLQAFKDEYERPDLQGVVPGGIGYVRPGQELKTLQHDRPGDNFVPFIDHVLRMACTCAGIPVEVALKRYGDMNYSSARAALLEAWRVFGYRQDWLIRHLCNWCWAIVAEECHLRGYVEMPDFYDYREAYCESRWLTPARGQIDPVKETQADILAWKYNMATQTDIAAKKGQDWEEDVAERRARENEIARIHGLEYPDKTKTTVSKENAK